MQLNVWGPRQDPNLESHFFSLTEAISFNETVKNRDIWKTMKQLQEMYDDDDPMS